MQKNIEIIFLLKGKITFGCGEKLARRKKNTNVERVKSRSWKKNKKYSLSIEKRPHLFGRNVAFAKSRPIYRIVGQISFDKSIKCIPLITNSRKKKEEECGNRNEGGKVP